MTSLDWFVCDLLVEAVHQQYSRLHAVGGTAFICERNVHARWRSVP